MKKILSLSVFLILFSIVALADIRLPETPKPDSKKSIDSFLSIKFDKNTKEAKLIIPKSQLKQLRAELEQLDNEQDTNANAKTGFTRAQTIIGGLFMSLAILSGGVWLTRTKKLDPKTGKNLVIGAILFLSGAVATIVYANAGPPPELRQITSKLFDKKVFGYWNSAGGKIKIQVSDTAQNPELIVPDVTDEKKPSDEE